MATPILVGIGVATAATLARLAIRKPGAAPSGLFGMFRAKDSFSAPSIGGTKPKLSMSKYAKGGFEGKMDRREAQLILGLSATARQVDKSKLKEAHRRIMLANHPDRGGSPYMASKINEAKDLLEKR